MKDYIVKTTRSLRAGGNIRNTLWSFRKGFQVVYLFDCLKNTGVVDGLPRVEIQRNKDMTPTREKSFLWMVAAFENE